MNEVIHTQYEDEIDLKEFWRTLLKFKTMIILLTGSITLLAAVYAYTKNPVYEAKAVLEIGSYANTVNVNMNPNWIENPAAVLKRLEIQYIENKNIEKKVWLDKVSFVKGTQNLLELSVLGFSKESATSYLKEIEVSVAIRHQKLVDAYVDSVRVKIDNLNTQKEELLIEKERLVHELNKKSSYVDKFTKENPTLAAIYSIEFNNNAVELKNLKNSIHNINNQLNDLNVSISTKNLKRTEYIDDISAKEYPIRPKKILIIFIGFFIGFMLSSLLAYLWNFKKKGIHD